jgi:hypothetical protein
MRAAVSRAPVASSAWKGRFEIPSKRRKVPVKTTTIQQAMMAACFIKGLDTMKETIGPQC